MAHPWFHLPVLPAAGEQATLEGAEARHVTGARRLQPGDTVCLFDGAGELAEAELESVGPRGRSVVLTIRSRTSVPAPVPRRHVACALPKGERQGVLLSMLTQLGMTAFTPVHAERSVARGGPGFERRAKRVFVESCKQSRRAHLPDLRAPGAVADVAAIAAAEGGSVLAAHPGGARWRGVLETLRPDEDVHLVVGPEGGLTDQEVEAAVGAGARLVELGTGILRLETAAVAMLAAVSPWLGE